VLEQEQEQEQEVVQAQEEIVAEQVLKQEQVRESKGFLFEEGIVFYSKEDPIPVNPPLPNGLIFKVQIGAFRNELPAEHFVGLSPMTAEALDNGITRYSVGIFRELSDAKVAKNKVNEIGYQDAFIVAFYNGKRIPINEAIQMLGQQGSEPVSLNKEVNENTASPVVKTEDFKNLVNTNPPDNLVTGGGEEAPATSVNVIKELFYCVQVGVFSRKVQLSELFGIQPLNLELTSNGYYRYTSGIYSSIEEALKQKDYVLSKGVVDAFITVYYDGDRISLDKANALILEDPSIIVSKNKSTKANAVVPDKAVKKEVTEAVKPDPVQPKKEEVIIKSPEVKKTLPDPSELSYVIYIGSYSNSIPNNVATALLENSDIGIKRAINGGKTIYSSKELNSLTDATVILQRFHERGVDQAKILYVLNGNEISEEEAYEILRK
jgi:cell division protein FtsN